VALLPKILIRPSVCPQPQRFIEELCVGEG
jgi:hypothetical protein